MRPNLEAMIHIDKEGIPFEVRGYEVRDHASLEIMYLEFDPADRFQGMPPLGEVACKNWIENFLKYGENLVALRDDLTIGHVVIFPDFNLKDCEYLVCVDQAHRGRGVGTALTQTVLDHAKALGLQIIWLVVGIHNYKAIGLYKKFNFKFADKSGLVSERKMILYL